MARSFSEECSYLEQVSSYSYRIKKGFVPNMKVNCSSWQDLSGWRRVAKWVSVL